MADHVCEWKLHVYLRCPDAPEVEPYCIHDTGGPTTCYLSEAKIEHRLNAIELFLKEWKREGLDDMERLIITTEFATKLESKHES